MANTSCGLATARAFRQEQPTRTNWTNRAEDPLVLLVVGARKVGEERIHYPDADDPGPFTVVRDERGERIL